MIEEAVGDEGVDVGVEIEVFAEGVEGHDDAGDALGAGQGGAEVFLEAFMGEGAEALEEVAVALEIGAEHFGDGQDVVAVGHGRQDAGGEEGGGGLDVFLVAGGAEPAAFAGEGQEVFEAAVVAADAGEAAFEVAAVEELVDDLRDDGAQGASRMSKDELRMANWGQVRREGAAIRRSALGIRNLPVAVGALPEERLARVAGAVKLHDGTCQHIVRR